jgi:ABC-type nitrate/sulfonate/bicarbonate transport system permease component
MAPVSQPLRGQEKLVVVFLQISLAIGAFALWHYATASKAISSIMLPPPDSVARSFVQIVRAGDFWGDLGVTLREVFGSFVLAASLGLALGFAISRRSFDIRVFEPMMAALYAVPIIVVYPLYVLFFGFGPASKIALGASVAFFPIVLHTISGFAGVAPRLIEAARVMGASNWKLFTQVLLPGAFPAVIAGMRIGFITGFLSVIGGEMLASYNGIGRLIIDQAEAMNTATMYAYIVILIILSLILNAIVFAVEAWLARRWRQAA